MSQSRIKEQKVSSSCSLPGQSFVLELDIQGECLIEASNRENMTEQALLVVFLLFFPFLSEENGKLKPGAGRGEVGHRA